MIRAGDDHPRIALRAGGLARLKARWLPPGRGLQLGARCVKLAISDTPWGPLFRSPRRGAGSLFSGLGLEARIAP